jgi:hypothetical protein
MKGEAVSEVIGAIILISLSVLAIGIIILVITSGPLPTSVPAFSGFITNSTKTVYITHEGGDTLYAGQFRILVDGNDTTYDFTKSLNKPTMFSVGQVMNATLTYMPSHVVVIFNTSWGGGTVLLTADLAGTVPFTPPGWYSGAWLNRKKITIDHTKVAGSLTGFPVLINRADATIGAKAQQPSGNDILFTSWDGTTKIPHEIESYNWNGGTMVIWVKVPSLSPTTDTVIYMYYDNPGATNQQSPSSVWDANYVGVWHLNETVPDESSAGTHVDSTSYGNNGAQNNNGQIGGQIGGAQNFDGNDYILGPDAASLDVTSQTTLEAWVYLSNSNNNQKIVGKTSLTPGVNTGYGYILGVQTGGLYPEFWDSAENGPITFTSGSVPNNAWTSLAVTYQTGGDIIGFVNGGQVNSIPASGNDIGTTGTNELRMGVGPYHLPPDQYFVTGRIDEVRVSNIARTLPWIQTEYTNENNPGVGGFLLSVSTEQTPVTMN